MSNSIGDLRNSGLQGNNFPWQLKMLQGLQALLDAQCDCDRLLSVLETIESYTAPQPRNASIRRYTNSSTISNAYSISIANVGAANGTVNGQNLAPGEIVTWDAGVLNNTLNTVSFDATGTEFLITWIS